MSPLVLSGILALTGFHLLALAQTEIQPKCTYTCLPLDGRDDYTNVLLYTKFKQGVMECTYGSNPEYQCRYNATTGQPFEDNRVWCRKLQGPDCTRSHPAGTMCYSYCDSYGWQPWNPNATELVCGTCHYDLNSGAFIGSDREIYSTCRGRAINIQCTPDPETLPIGWSVAIPCAVDSTGTGNSVMPSNVAVPLLSLGGGDQARASDCIKHCHSIGHSVAAVEDSTTCYCASRIADNAVSVDPGQCQSRCFSREQPSNYADYSCGGKLRLQVYKRPSCPDDLDGSPGRLITLKETLFTCAYPRGSCTWYADGTLRNTEQANCPKTAH